MTADRTEDQSEAGKQDHLALWLGPLDRRTLDPRRLRGGLVTVEAATPAPCYVTLRIRCADPALAPLIAPLERIALRRYRATVQLIAPAAEAWLEFRPGLAGAAVDVIVSRPSVQHLARLGLGALRRHVSDPAAFMKKLVQITRGGTSLVLSERSSDLAPEDEYYSAWQSAFDGAAVRQRLMDAWERANGARPVRLLAYVRNWPGTSAELDEALQALKCAERTELAWVGSGASAAKTADLDQAIERQQPDLVVCLDRPGHFHPLAPLALAVALSCDADAVAATGDHDFMEPSGKRFSPIFKPGWSPRYQGATDYVRGVAAFRPTWLRSTPQQDRGSTAPSARQMLTRVAAERRSASHVPLVLFHARENSGQQATPPPTAAVTYPEIMPTVSVIIPTKDNPVMLAAAIASVRAAQGIDAELIVVDNGATSEAQKVVLANVEAMKTGHGRGQVIAAHEQFNFSRLINIGRRMATGEVLVLLNDDVEATDPGWLRALACEAMKPDTGAVGALLLYPDGRVQHAGVLLGIRGGAGHSWRFADPASPFMAREITAMREVSAVTAACLAVRADLFDQVSGFSEDLPVTLNDVDFCLKLRALGVANVYLPDARLTHRESTSRGLDATPEKLRRLSGETATFMKRWGAAALVDPYRSPHADPAREDMRPRAL